MRGFKKQEYSRQQAAREARNYAYSFGFHEHVGYLFFF